MPVTHHRIAFVGCGYTQPTRKLDKSEVDIAVEACKTAAADAGIDPADIDGINIQVHHYPPPDTAAIARELGMKEVRWTRDGGMGIGAAAIAAQALDAGQCKAVVVCKVMNTIAPVNTPQIDPSSGKVAGFDQFEVPYGLGYLMQRIGLRARRYMHHYGVTPEQIGWLCITQREGALLNPWAFMKKPLTMAEYLGSRWIADPVRLLDCDVPVNGAYAFVITRDDLAKTLRHPPIYLRAWAGTTEPGFVHLQSENRFGMVDFAKQLYADAGMGPAEMDLWFMYDGFSFFVLWWMENLGLVPRGEGGAYIDGGKRIAIEGEHPLNPHGGQLSEGRLHGHGGILEAVQQLRGTAGPRQTSPRNTAIISSVIPDAIGAAGILVRDWN